MSRRKIRKPVVPQLERLETRQLLSVEGHRVPIVRPLSVATDEHPHPTLEPRPDLDKFALKLMHDPGFARVRGLGMLSRDLYELRNAVARDGAGATLGWLLEHHPDYASRHRLTGLLRQPISTVNLTPPRPSAPVATSVAPNPPATQSSGSTPTVAALSLPPAGPPPHQTGIDQFGLILECPCLCPQTANCNVAPGGLPSVGGLIPYATQALFSNEDMVNGAYLQDHATAEYTSQGMPNGLDFQYSSMQANDLPTPNFWFTSTNDWGTVTKSEAHVTLSNNVGGLVTYPGTIGVGTLARLALPSDARSLSSKVYALTIILTKYYSDGTNFTEQATFAYPVVNNVSSPYGAGWSVGGLQQLVPTGYNGDVLISSGYAAGEIFTTTDGVHYTGDEMDTSTLTANTNGTWALSFSVFFAASSAVSVRSPYSHLTSPLLI